MRRPGFSPSAEIAHWMCAANKAASSIWIKLPIPPATSRDPRRRWRSRETFGSLLRLLDELPDNQREVIRLKFQNDLSYKEIADVTQLSVTNVGFLLHTGLKKLRALVEAAPRDEWPIRQTV
jgi:RNA polymerase sigma-70 factor (ECF subfamily)